MYLASVQGFVNQSLAFVVSTSRTGLIDRPAVSALFSLYKDDDKSYASVTHNTDYLYTWRNHSMVTSAYIAGVQAQVDGMYSAAVSHLP
jgi:hypothetical protein